MKKLSLVLMLVLCAVGVALAQRTVSGKVTDAGGEPLIGASILVKGTSTGTVTDVDGTYSLTVPDGGTILVFTYTGFSTQEVTLGASNVVDVTMAEAAEQLSEVLVTAIGIQREKKALGYAASDVSSDQITQRSEPDPVRTLAGKVPGVNIQAGGGAPGQNTKINIRGNSSLTGNTQPLFVVDGIPFDNSINATTNTAGGTQYSNRAFDIDPNNIESITVLKGAAAAALYGSRATNGVIVITTKTGKKKNKGLEVSYNTSYSIETLGSLPEYQNVYTQGSNQNYNGGFIGNWGAPFPEHVDRLNAQYGTPYSKTYATYKDANGVTQSYPEGTVPHPLVFPTSYGDGQGYDDAFPELLWKDANGNIIRNSGGQALAMPVPLRSYNIFEPFFQDGHLAENSISINAGGEGSSLSATVSRMDNEGIVPNSKASRTSLSFGGNAALTNGLIVSGNMNYVNTTQSNPPVGGSVFTDYGATGDQASIYSRIYYLPRNFDLNQTNPEGIPYPFENPINGNNVFYRALDNPLWLTKYHRYTSNLNRAFGFLALSYDVLPWLNLTARGGMNSYTDNRRSYSRPGGVDDPNGGIWTEDLTNTEIDFNYLTTITPDIGETFDLRFIAGLNLNQRSLNRRYVRGDGIITASLPLTSATTTQLVDRDFSRRQRLYAVYADVQLGYKGYAYLGITARNDWTSTLPQGNNNYFYPGVNASFVFTDALGISSNTFGYGKIRAAWTQVGNEATPYQTATTYRFNDTYNSPNGSKVNRATLGNTLGNPNLVNELTTEIEFGTDLRFFRNRVGIDFTWFKRNSVDQITRAFLPRSTGFVDAVVNAGEIENKGIEVGLDLTPIRTASGFDWNVYVSFSRIKSLVVDAGPGGDIIIGGPYGGLSTVHRTGFPYGQILGSANARTESFDENGNYIGKGELLVDPIEGLTIFLPESQVIGDPNPDFIMGIINTFSFKGISLRTLFDWRQGGDLFSSTAGSLLLRGMLKFSEDREGLRVIRGVQGDPQTYEPIKDENGNFIQNTTTLTSFAYHFSNGFGSYGADETNVYDATVIRLRELSLSYDFPKKLMEKTPFGSLRLSVSGRNLWFYAPNMLKDSFLDPEVLGENADSNSQGFEYGATPNTRRFGVNLSVTF